MMGLWYVVVCSGEEESLAGGFDEVYEDDVSLVTAASSHVRNRIGFGFGVQVDES